MKFEKSFEAIRQLSNVIHKNNRSKYTLDHIKKGGFLKLKNDLCVVENIFTYSAGNEKWYEIELYSILTSETIYLEYEIDDTIEMYQTIKAFNVRELGFSMDAIEEMSDNEKGSFKFENQTFFYEDDYKAKFSRNETDAPEKLYLYEFSNEAEDLFLTIEEWESQDGDQKEYDYKGYLSKQLTFKDIEVLSL